MASCNENGVYTADETLELPRPKKGWNGVPIAEIDLVDLGTHWLWATGFQLWGSDFWGASSPLCDRDGYRSESREAAIASASAYLRRKVGSRVSECTDARAIIAWIDALIPDQLDLFGAAV